MGTNGERRGSAQLALKHITFHSARLPPVPAGSSHHLPRPLPSATPDTWQTSVPPHSALPGAGLQKARPSGSQSAGERGPGGKELPVLGPVEGGQGLLFWLDGEEMHVSPGGEAVAQV